MKPKLAMYWAASCGGCEVALFNIGEHLFTLDEQFEIVFFPFLADFKYSDLVSYADASIDLGLFNGAIRTSENKEMAELLRRKSKILVAFGSCAEEGCIPALSNLSTAEATFESVYLNNPSTRNPEKTIPQPTFSVPEGELSLPVFYDTVSTLDQVVDVDYSVPGCPPEPHRIWPVLEALLHSLTTGEELPPSGPVGCEQVALCEECPLPRDESPVARFYRPHEVVAKPETCLLDQGILCLGPATRGGCGALCPLVGMGCRGCYGLPPGVEDHGASMVSVIATVMAVGSAEHKEQSLRKQVEEAMQSVVDPTGSFYRFSMARSLLKRARSTETNR